MLKLINTILIGLSTGAIYSLMSISLVLVWRSTRVVNFAQAGQAVFPHTLHMKLPCGQVIFGWH